MFAHPAEAGGSASTEFTSIEGDVLVVARKGRMRYRLTVREAPPIDRDAITCTSVFTPPLWGHSPEPEPRSSLGMLLVKAGRHAPGYAVVWSFEEIMGMVSSIPVIGPGMCVAGIDVVPAGVQLKFAHNEHQRPQIVTFTREDTVAIGQWLMK